MAQRVDNEANPEQLQRAADPAMNPTVELHRTKEDTIEEFIRQHSTINLDWYVPDLCNTRVGDLIKKRLQLKTMEGKSFFALAGFHVFTFMLVGTVPSVINLSLYTLFSMHW